MTSGGKLEIQIINTTIFIKDNEVLEPSTATSNKGTTVLWVNTSNFPVKIVFLDKKVKHICGPPVNFTVGEDGTYNHADIPRGGTASLCFEEKGIYNYKIESSRTLLLEYGKRERKESRGTIMIK